MSSDAAPPAPSRGPDLPAPSRRELLCQTVATATVAWLWFEGVPDPTRRRRVVATAPDETPKNLSPREWATLEAALDRLLPSGEGFPGARDVHAIGYLDGALSDPGVDPDHVQRVHEGARLLDEHATAHGAATFDALPPDLEDEGVRSLETPWARQLVLRALLSFALEAYLGDPVHGGNPDRRVWRWADLEPGYPRPLGPWQPRGAGPQAKDDR